MRIDAHQHYWKIKRGDYSWITPEVTSLYRDFLPSDLQPYLNKYDIHQTILVQAAPTIEETEYILQLSESNESIAGVVGWLNLEDPHYKTQYEAFRKHPKFIGFRLMIQDMEDASVVLTKPYIDALTFFAEEDVPIDLLVVHHQLPVLIKLLEEIPSLRGVIDHIGKPAIAAKEIDTWKQHIQKLATFETIYCKLSGMITEADHKSWKKEDFIPYIQVVLRAFGSKRVMFGSDWPVCNLAGSYDDVMGALTHALPTMTDQEEELLFGDNAKIFYKI
ncbi:amidohydrolase family protein [Halalkalibacter urbisdiaboli]|uniref:amidohydrolase family protein n=1 Tax=Halalkalibacter urbisdiaboli TaxID=1960589 RepID=UPI000B4444D3|nr:amidohydrolase family protein [Halalkalibacter urbisdiaboli]